MDPETLTEARRRLATTFVEPHRKRWTKATLEALGVGLHADGRFVFALADDDGHDCGAVFYNDTPGAKPKAMSEPGTVRELWPRPEDVPGDVLMVVEGEPDAVSAREMGFAAVALPGAGKVGKDWPRRIAYGRVRVDFVGDADSVGRRRMNSTAAKVAREGPDTFVVDPAPERDDGYDVGDMLAEHGREDAALALQGMLAKATRADAEPDPDPPVRLAEFVATSSEVLTVSMADVTPQSVKWLWKPYVPLGKVTILAGAPGLGKSQLTAMLAAQVTRASFYDTDHHTPANAIILSAEDDLADTVVPRLMAANADLRRVEAISVKKTYPEGVTTHGTIKLPGNVGDLARRLARKPEVKLVVFDPVASFFGRDHSTHSNQDVRDLLDPLVALAAHYAVAVLLLLHLNKSDAKTWAEKIAESHGFQAVARSVLVLAPDPEAEEEEEDVSRVLAIPKLNLARAATFALRCKIEGATVTGHDGEPIETARMKMLGRVDMPADDLLLSSEFGEKPAREEAGQFLHDFLKNGWRPVADVKAEAQRRGVGWRSVERVRRNLTKRAKQQGVPHGPWWMALKTDKNPVPKTGDVGDVGGLTPSNIANADQDRPFPMDDNVVALPMPPRAPRSSNGRTADQRTAMERMLGERDDDDDGA